MGLYFSTAVYLEGLTANEKQHKKLLPLNYAFEVIIKLI